MIHCRTSGRKYIGQCRSLYGKDNHKGGIEVRWRAHIKDALTNPHRGKCRALVRAMRKYGINDFIISPIKICPVFQLNYYERKFIRQYKTLSPNGYNIKEGGDVCKQSEETKKLISEALTGIKRGPATLVKMRKSQLGKKLSEETKRKMSEAHLGKKMSDETKRKISEGKKRSLQVS